MRELAGACLEPLRETDMSINIGPPSIDELRPRITVIGVGGAGGNAIANMIGAGIEGQTVHVRTEGGRLLSARPTGDRQVEITL